MLTTTYIGIHILKGHGGLGKVAALKTGPNDMQCVIWAISKFISPSFGILLILITMYR